MIDATQLVGSEGCARPLTGKGRCCTLGRFGTRRWRCGGGGKSRATAQMHIK